VTNKGRPFAVFGAGFIGMHFVRYALQWGHALTILDHKSVPDDLFRKVNWMQGDFASRADIVRALVDADTVFHFISSTVPGDMVDISSELQKNVFQTLQLLEACIEQKVRRIVFVSSASVYGPQKTLPISETAPTDPVSAHGIHKLAIEKYLQLYHHQYGLDCRILRVSNPFGPGQCITGRQGFIAIAIGRIVAGENLMLRGDGTYIRDFIYIDDVVDALYRTATIDSSERVFNVGSGLGYSLNEVVALMRDLTGLSIPVVYSNSRHADVPESVLDISRLRPILRMKVPLSLRAGLVKTLTFHGISCRSK